MPHVSDVTASKPQNFLLYGGIGSGKTTQFRTIPGRKFLYMFDPAGMASIRKGDDIFYEEFLPDSVSMSVSTLKGIKDSQAPQYEESTAYVNWESHFEKCLRAGFFTNPEVELDFGQGPVKGGFDAIGFDSLTTMMDLIMDRVLEINKRQGKQPEISDYGVAAQTLARIVRNANALGIWVFFTGHENPTQDKLLRTVSNELMVAGQLKKKLPILFSDIWHCRSDLVGTQQKYYIDTTPSESFPTARCSMNLPPTMEVTIGNLDDPTKYGLGKILRDKGLGK